MTKIHLRLDSVTLEHITQTLFMDGKNCGKLVIGHGQYQILGAALLVAAAHMKEQLEVVIDPIAWDYEGNFMMPVSWQDIGDAIKEKHRSTTNED